MDAALDDLLSASSASPPRVEAALDALSDCSVPRDVGEDLDAALDALSNADSEAHQSDEAIDPAAGALVLHVEDDAPLCTPDAEPIVFSDPMDRMFWLARCTPDAELDERHLRLAHFFTQLDSPTTTDTTAAVIVGQGDSLPVSRRWLSYNRVLTAAAALKHERLSWEKLETKVVESCAASQGASQAFIYMEATAYDGLDIALRGKSQVVMPDGAVICDDTCADAVAASPLADQPDEGRCKVLQSECHNIMAFTRGDVCNVIVGSQLMHLQKSDRTTGECMGALLDDHSIGIPGHPNFARRIRNVCTDRYYPNYLGEGALGQAPARIGFSTIHIPCHAHIGATGLVSAASICRSIIVPIRAYVGSLRAPGEMQKFRNASQSWLWKHLECVETGSPSSVLDGGAKAFRSLVLDTLLSHDAAHAMQLKFIVTSCAPGDWRSLGKFIFVVEPHPGPSKDSVFKFIVQHLFAALFGHTPWRFPEGKWTGSDKTFLDIGLPASIHGMLAGIWREYMVLYHKDEVPAAVKHGWAVGPPMAPGFIHGKGSHSHLIDSVS